MPQRRVEHPARRHRIDPNSVDAIASHVREVGLDRGWEEAGIAAIPGGERAVRDTADIELPRAAEEKFAADERARVLGGGRFVSRDGALLFRCDREGLPHVRARRAG